MTAKQVMENEVRSHREGKPSRTRTDAAVPPWLVGSVVGALIGALLARRSVPTPSQEQHKPLPLKPASRHQHRRGEAPGADMDSYPAFCGTMHDLDTETT